MTSPLALYQQALDDVGRTVANVAVDRWDAGSPCPGWSARSVVGHVIDAQRQVVAMVTGNDLRTPVTDVAMLAALAGPDPHRNWRSAAEEIADVLRGAAPEAPVVTPLGRATVRDLLGMALIEPLVHTWDLAVATGQPARLDPDAVAATLPGVLALGAALQQSGMYGAALAPPPDASPQDRLIAALGRDPRAGRAAAPPPRPGADGGR